MQQMHQGQLPGPPNPLPAVQSTQSNQYGNAQHVGPAFDASQNGGPSQQPSQVKNGSGNMSSTSQFQVPQEAQDKSSTFTAAPISQTPVVADESKNAELAHDASVKTTAGDTQVGKKSKKEKERAISLVYSDMETSPEEKMAKLSRYAFDPTR